MKKFILLVTVLFLAVFALKASNSYSVPCDPGTELWTITALNDSEHDRFYITIARYDVIDYIPESTPYQCFPKGTFERVRVSPAKQTSDGKMLVVYIKPSRHGRFVPVLK